MSLSQPASLNWVQIDGGFSNFIRQQSEHDIRRKPEPDCLERGSCQYHSRPNQMDGGILVLPNGCPGWFVFREIIWLSQKTETAENSERNKENQRVLG